MKTITFDEILPLADYERVRGRLRPLFIHEKERRRLHVGSHLTFIFENAQTAWYQIEEMIKAEKMTHREAIQHEIDTYNELLPAAGEIAATLLIEYAEPRERDAALARLAGLERHLWLKIGPQRIAARFDDRQMSDERISAVQFVRFSIEGVDAARFLELAGKGEVAVEADHPSVAAQGAIEGLLAASLAEDLR
ncbi:MAG: DUF3501 family protein [Candidatus Binatus sp.]|uniref:DUF3501 family protein n=1 Tax=Candidatus Binatus sp. TaxID=2811406 RepID=UPI003C750B66